MKTPRLASPRRLGLTLSVTLAAMPALAETPRPVTLSPGATLWLAAGTEGGEAGEAGLTAGAADDTAYLAELSIVEGHYHAARDLFAKGQKDLARDLAGHPEEEGTLKGLAAEVTARGAADPSPAIAAFRKALAGEDAAAVDTALAELAKAFAADAAPEAAETRKRFDAVVLLVKAAAEEYEGATEGGKISDAMGWHEAYSFVSLAKGLLEGLAAETLSAKAAPRALEALKAADEAFGDPTAAELKVADPGILLGVAAKVELIASSVR